jgi:hypothetical protein
MIQGNGFTPPGQMGFVLGKPGLGLGRLKKLQAFNAGAPPFVAVPGGLPVPTAYPNPPGLMMGGLPVLNGIRTVNPPQPGLIEVYPTAQRPPSGMNGILPAFPLQPVGPPLVQPPSPDAVFVKLDANRDGVITRQELDDNPALSNQPGLTPEIKEQAWKTVDINGDSQITRVEFLQFSTQNQAVQLFGQPPNFSALSGNIAQPQGLNTLKGTLQAFGLASP